MWPVNVTISSVNVTLMENFIFVQCKQILGRLKFDCYTVLSMNIQLINQMRGNNVYKSSRERETVTRNNIE